MSFYVYTYFIEGIPRYVGKGVGSRWKKHRRLKSHLGNSLRKIKAEYGEWIIPQIIEFNSSEEALKEEVRLIAFYGRQNIGMGPLWNLTDGGEGTVGNVVSEQTKRKISEGVRNSQTHSIRTKQGMTIDARQKIAKNSALSRSLPEYRLQRSEIGKRQTDKKIIARSKMAERFKHDIELKQKISENTKKAMQNPEVRKRISDSLLKYFSEHKAKGPLGKKIIRKPQKLSNEQIIEIFLHSGPHLPISKKFNIHVSTVSTIKQRNSPLYKRVIESYLESKK